MEHKVRRILSLVFAAIGALLILPCPALAKLPVMVSIVPQKYFVQKVGGDLVSVGVMVQPGASPHDYEPKPSQMAALAKAKAYFAIGVEFEKAWLPRFLAANPKLMVVHTEAKVPRVAMQGRHEHDDHDGGHKAEEHGHDKHAGEHKAEKHDHDHHAEEHKGGEHHHHAEGAPDPHIWLAPRLVMIQAKAIHDALAKLDPAHAADYNRNLAAFETELKELDQNLRRAFTGLGEKRAILVFHPAWGYLCRSYGLKQIAVEKEGKEPTAQGSWPNSSTRPGNPGPR